jgi:ubiquinone/menaquinone biosynthesis C-methylase UbiE
MEGEAPMPTSQEIQDQQKKVWNTAAPGWKKWDAYLLKRFEPVTQAMLDEAHLAEGQSVLELACGTGEPGIPAAKRLGKGRVTGTDQSEEMMAVAEEKAKAQGVLNYSTRAASALSLPFPDSQFDAVLCRWGIMFFPDPRACLRETRRVMKPGAWASFATWNAPDKNPYLSLPIKVAIQKMGLTPPPPEAPGVFRFPNPQELAALMSEAGFKNPQVREVVGESDFDSPEHYFEFVSEVVGPFRAAMAQAQPAVREQIKAGLLEQVKPLVKDGRVRSPYSSWIVSAQK